MPSPPLLNPLLRAPLLALLSAALAGTPLLFGVAMAATHASDAAHAAHAACSAARPFAREGGSGPVGIAPSTARVGGSGPRGGAPRTVPMAGRMAGSTPLVPPIKGRHVKRWAAAAGAAQAEGTPDDNARGSGCVGAEGGAAGCPPNGTSQPRPPFFLLATRLPPRPEASPESRLSAGGGRLRPAAGTSAEISAEFSARGGSLSPAAASRSRSVSSSSDERSDTASRAS